MDAPVQSIEKLFDRIEEYGKTTIELTKLRALDSSIKVLTLMASRMSVVLMVSFAVLIFSLGMAMYLGDLLGKIHYGFFIVSGFYMIVGIIFYIFLHDWIKKPVSDLIISELLN
ncbi:MAG: hypothetical protein IPH31_25870 [Lewinellaceae bacterium]|nr:hypothetical protein [Lewinellaceae bacterium]